MQILSRKMFVRAVPVGAIYCNPAQTALSHNSRRAQYMAPTRAGLKAAPVPDTHFRTRSGHALIVYEKILHRGGIDACVRLTLGDKHHSLKQE